MAEEKGEAAILHYFGFKGRCFDLLISAQYWGKQDELKWHKYSMEDWKKNPDLPIKQKATFGQLPVLENGDFVLCQSNAILRYFANKWGKRGDTDDDFATSEMLMEKTKELMAPVLAAAFGKQKTIAAAINEECVKHLVQLEQMMSNGKFCSSRTMGEFTLFAALHMITGVVPTALDKFMGLHEFYREIYSNPAVKEFCDTTPNSPFIK